MACTIASGRIEQCKDSVSGLKAIYFINYQIEPSHVTYDVTNTDMITAVTNVDSLYKFELKSTENSFEQTINSDRNNGTTYFTQTLNAKLKKQDVTTSKVVKLLAYGRPHVVISTNSGQFFLMGLNHGADLTAGALSSGAALGDFNGYSLTLEAMEECYANFLNASSESAMVTLFTSATLVVG
ncbi:hypothetical protein UFOVP622_26 [uncultured Caudovirales phage]|uniref:Uncharacterized protein n=1 Tax=uncultured Caudovirales phage TaxID=2100421 RepID=A0A6J5N2R8_9CAUD|nr:hypothetical protein UFOVP622_26 [uncultured Caudovirales phage]